MIKETKNQQDGKKKVRHQGQFYDALIFESPDVKFILQAINVIAYYLECVSEFTENKADRNINIQKAISCTDRFNKIVEENKNKGNGAGLQSINEFVMEADVVNKIIEKYLNSNINLDVEESSKLYSKLFRLQYILSVLREELK
jgi:hypothetical protein